MCVNWQWHVAWYSGAQPAPYGRVGYVEARTLHAAMFFLPQVGVIPTEAVIEGQLACDLPAVLDIKRISVIAQPQIRNPADLVPSATPRKKLAYPNPLLAVLENGMPFCQGSLVSIGEISYSPWARPVVIVGSPSNSAVAPIL